MLFTVFENELRCLPVGKVTSHVLMTGLLFYGKFRITIRKQYEDILLLI